MSNGDRIHRLVGISLFLIAAPAMAGWEHIGAAGETGYEPAAAVFRFANALVRVEAVNEHVLRVRMTPGSTFGRDFSWAVADATPRGKLKREAVDEGEGYEAFSTGALTVRVHTRPFRMEVLDAEGRTLVRDEAARGMGRRRVNEECIAVRVWQEMPDGVRIYGLGEKAGPLEHSERAFSMWNTDAWGYGPTTDPLYKSIPFFLVEREGRYHGIFLDNPWRTSFDFGKEDRNVMSFGAEGGELNYYVIAGPGPKDVLQRYTDLTGRIELPPKWALGYHQCRYSYYPEARVREIAKTFRAKNIPCDVIYFDIDYMDAYRSFTWHPEWFPDPKKLTDDLKAMNFHTVAIIDPGIKHEPGDAVYDSGTKIDAWLKRPDGEPYVGRVWPGDCVFPDFTNPAVRDWWAGLFPPFLQACGVDGIWNDMNEPANFAGPNKTLPLDVRFDNEGEPAPHRACHNVYGQQMARATLEGIRRTRPDRRPFTMTRATYAGGQRYGAAWTGDNISNWEHLQLSITMTMGLGVSGMPFVGPDIGGFAHGPTPELFARWIQAGSLLPYCRTHTACYNPDQEPWSYGAEVEEIARQSLRRRYELMPYLYTLFEECARTGVPIVRPIWMEFPGEHPWFEDTAFMLGSDILVWPIVWPDAREGHVSLPPGVWFDWHTGEIHGGGQPVLVPAGLDHLPLFVRAGSIIPMQSAVESTMETPVEPLILDVWPFGESKGSLYEDDGQSIAYRRGEFCRSEFTCQADEHTITISLPACPQTVGGTAPLIRFRGLGRPVASVVVTPEGPETAAHISEPAGDEPLTEPGAFRFDPVSRAWLVRVLPRTRGQTVLVRLVDGDGVAREAVTLRFDETEQPIRHHRSVLPPVYSEGGVEVVVRHAGNPQLLLPRLRLSAEALPMLRVRLATDHATTLGVQFATEQEPTRSDQPAMRFAITADGKVHEYFFDLQAASEGRWSGTVYWVMLSFPDNSRQGETIRVESVAFEPAAGM